MLDKQEVQSFIDLVNTGTISLESFGDTSIYSHYGQVKLGLDNMVRITRDKRFVIENSGKDAYVSFTPRGTTIRNSAYTSVKGDKQEKIDGFIALESDTIKLWEDGYVLPKPKLNDSYLTFSIAGSNTDGHSYGLEWKTLDTASSALTKSDIYKKYGDKVKDIIDIVGPYLYCIGELVVYDNTFNTEVDNKSGYLSMNIYLDTYYFHGDIKLSLNFSPNNSALYGNKFGWDNLVPLSGVTIIDNTEIKNDIAFDNVSNVSPLWICGYWQKSNEKKDLDSEGNPLYGYTRYRIYTPTLGERGCAHFIHSLERMGSRFFDWTNEPDFEISDTHNVKVDS